jgi:hypothetical protein
MHFGAALCGCDGVNSKLFMLLCFVGYLPILAAAVTCTSMGTYILAANATLWLTTQHHSQVAPEGPQQESLAGKSVVPSPGSASNLAR